MLSVPAISTRVYRSSTFTTLSTVCLISNTSSLRHFLTTTAQPRSTSSTLRSSHSIAAGRTTRPLLQTILQPPHTMPVSTAAATAPALAASKSDITEEVGGLKNVQQLHATSRDFRSDTFTMPTDAQLLFALTASRGDDVYEEDETTRALEQRMAWLTGKEAALFGMSGTMTNQLAIRTHMKQPPHSIITDHRAHVHKNEAGGIAMFSQATTHALVPSNGAYLTAEDIDSKLELGTNIHIAPTKLICLENTLNGGVFPQEEVIKISELAKKHGIALHVDGARIWNVAAKEVEDRGLDASVEENRRAVLTDLLAPFDTASICLSKGIGAPIGSVIVGTQEFIDRARWFRKAFGGGVRQIGGMAAAADYAITHHFPRLPETHALARRLAKGLEEIGCEIKAKVDTNMVIFDPRPAGLELAVLAKHMASIPDPIKLLPFGRCVIHHQTSPQAVDDLLAEMAKLKAAVPEGTKLELGKTRFY